MTTLPIARVRALAARSRRPACAVAGQVLNAATNVVTAYVASVLLRPAEFGTFVVAFAIVTVVLAAGRGLIGATMLVHLPAQDEADRAELVRSALGFTILAGLGASVLVVLAAVAQPVLLFFAPWVTAALLQDVGRYVFLSAGRTGRALALDVVWAVVQAVVLAVGIVVSGAVSLELVATAWGLGASAGTIAFMAFHRLRPIQPGRWARVTRDVAGWFTAVAVVGQVEIYLVLFLTGVLLAPADVGGVRAVQLLAFHPPLVLLAALLMIVQPMVVRARSSPDALRAASHRVTMIMTPVICGLAALAVLREPLMAALFGQYVGYAPLVVPVAIQSAFVALMIAPLTVLNGLRQGATAFSIQAMRTAGLVAAAVVGMRLAGVWGLAWALAISAAVAWGQAALSARRAISRLGAHP